MRGGQAGRAITGSAEEDEVDINHRGLRPVKLH